MFSYPSWVPCYIALAIEFFQAEDRLWHSAHALHQNRLVGTFQPAVEFYQLGESGGAFAIQHVHILHPVLFFGPVPKHNVWLMRLHIMSVLQVLVIDLLGKLAGIPVDRTLGQVTAILQAVDEGRGEDVTAPEGGKVHGNVIQERSPAPFD